jgi:phosphatidylglycerol:prolipoprotein diacylglycerol transferase
MHLLIILPDLDPVAFNLGPIAVRWYSIAYILGILFALFFLKKCNQKDKIMSQQAYDDWLMWAVLSVLLGGRVGYVLFYNPIYFISHPLEILAFWHGGMSFHGGLIGVIFGMFLFTQKYKIEFFKLTDILAVTAPVGLFFGRIANFINMELYGRVTNGDYGVIFPNAGELPRHPSQLYEAALEGLLSFLILISLYKFTKLKNKVGFLSGTFLVLYGSSRIIIENFREPDAQIGFLFGNITMGQFLSFPIILFGLFIIFKSNEAKLSHKN